MFDLIYNWFFNLFDSDKINLLTFDFMGNTLSLTQWLSITCTLISLGLLIWFCISVVIWCFNIFYSTFKRI